MFVTHWTKGREHATMGSMSASDAAPLPRLGEVFFDVRGSSRSMRLSWYADTGISVFSIWQGGTCTGTFRLPREELPRLIESLRRGMHGAEQRDPRGLSGYARQLSGDPTDPRLTMLPGYAGPRDGDFTGPVTGDFRALRADDSDRGPGPLMLGSASPRALPAPPAALPPGSYRDQPRYSEPAQQPEPVQYAEYAQYAQPAQYAEPAQYAQPAQYAEQGYAEPGYGTRNGYGDQGYGTPGEQGYQSYGYGEQGAYPGRGYGEQSYQGQGPQAEIYAGHGYDQGDQRYDDHGYAQHGYQDQGYPERGRHDPGRQPEQAYGRYGHADPPKHAQGAEARGNYPGPDGAAGPGSLAAYAEPGYQHQRGPAERGYSEPPAGQAYADQAYDAYRYAERDYRGQGYPSPDESGQAYPERDYGSYAGADQAGNGNQAGYYGSPGHDGAGYGNAGYGNPGHDGAAYGTAGYGSPGHDGAAYGNAGHDGAAYSNAGYGSPGHD